VTREFRILESVKGTDKERDMRPEVTRRGNMVWIDLVSGVLVQVFETVEDAVAAEVAANQVADQYDRLVMAGWN
jgi:hypothetical protein